MCDTGEKYNYFCDTLHFGEAIGQSLTLNYTNCSFAFRLQEYKFDDIGELRKSIGQSQNVACLTKKGDTDKI